MKKINVYSTEMCPWCKKLKAFLEEKKIEFEEHDVSKEPEARQEMIEKSGQMGVPVIDIDGKVIVGFDQPAIEKELEKK